MLAPTLSSLHLREKYVAVSENSCGIPAALETCGVSSPHAKTRHRETEMRRNEPTLRLDHDDDLSFMRQQNFDFTHHAALASLHARLVSDLKATKCALMIPAMC